jgi:hypothetical protein
MLAAVVGLVVVVEPQAARGGASRQGDVTREDAIALVSAGEKRACQ